MDLEKATADIAAEFDRILNSSSPIASPKKQSHMKDDLRKLEFYELIDQFYPKDIKRHVSPTKRLIAQKNSTWEHKEAMKGCHT